MRIGSLCSGYNGLDMGVQAVLGGSLAWVSDIDKGACAILAHRYPDAPNLGDFTTTDWSTVEPVDVLTAGFPCQPVSGAGKRLGDQDERWLWDDVARAVGALRPGLVVLENVRGLLTAGSGRLFGRVLGSLAELGYDAQWHGLRAADVGAPHNRWRVFIAAHPRGETVGLGTGLRPSTAPRFGGRRLDDHDLPGHLLPTPRATDGTKGGPNQRGSSGDLMLPSAVVSMLLPTPAVNDMGEGKTVEAWDEWTAKMQAAHGNGNGHGKSLAIEAQRLLPTPMVGSTSPAAHGQISGQWRDAMADALARWGDYADAIGRWERVLGRPAPAPTEPGAKGAPRLSPAFVEWMMGLPAGHVTDVADLTRNAQLKALGNGVVPQQAEAAIRLMLARNWPGGGMSDRIYTVSDYPYALAEIHLLTLDLRQHAPHADHCGGYDVAAWPCEPAAHALRKLLGDEA